MRLLFIIVNALFVAKYSARLFPNLYIYISLAYIFVMIFLLWKVMPWLMDDSNKNKYALVSGITAIVLMLFVQYSINPLELQVDRWSALHYPIKNLLQGIYPYSAQTHLGGYGSPFPAWQLFHIPFYLLGNVGLSFFFCLATFLYLVYKMYGINKMTYTMVLLIISPAIWYEVAVRSDYIGNMLLCASFVIYIIKGISQESIERNRLPISVIIALFVCTRLITLLPVFILLFPYWLKMSVRKKTEVLFLISISCIFIFLPFALMDWHSFFYFEYNPWKLQTRQGHPLLLFIYIPIIIYFAMQWKGNVQQYLRNISLALMIFIVTTFIYRSIDHDNYNLFSSLFDITYFNAIVPFVVLYISMREKWIIMNCDYKQKDYYEKNDRGSRND